MGQVLSVVGTFLPAAFGEALESLPQDQVPARPFSEIEGRLREAFGDDPLSRALPASNASRSPPPHSHRFTAQRPGTAERRSPSKCCTPDRGVDPPRPGRAPLTIAGDPQWVVQVGRVERVFEELSAMLARETDYLHERANMTRIRAIFHRALGCRRARGDCGADLRRRAVDDIRARAQDQRSRRLNVQGIDADAVARLLVDCYFTMLLQIIACFTPTHTRGKSPGSPRTYPRDLGLRRGRRADSRVVRGHEGRHPGRHQQERRSDLGGARTDGLRRGRRRPRALEARRRRILAGARLA